MAAPLKADENCPGNGKCMVCEWEALKLRALSQGCAVGAKMDAFLADPGHAALATALSDWGKKAGDWLVHIKKIDGAKRTSFFEVYMYGLGCARDEIEHNSETQAKVDSDTTHTIIDPRYTILKRQVLCIQQQLRADIEASEAEMDRDGAGISSDTDGDGGDGQCAREDTTPSPSGDAHPVQHQ